MSGITFRQNLRFTGFGESLLQAFCNLHITFPPVNAKDLASLSNGIIMRFVRYAPIFFTTKAPGKIETSSFQIAKNLSVAYFVSK